MLLSKKETFTNNVDGTVNVIITEEFGDLDENKNPIILSQVITTTFGVNKEDYYNQTLNNKEEKQKQAVTGAASAAEYEKILIELQNSPKWKNTWLI